MQALVAALGGTFVVACLVVGLRLLALARRTRQAPERWMGIGLLLLGGVGAPLMEVARRSAKLAPGLRVACAVAAAALLAAGASSIALFARSVFRPQAFAASATCAALPLAFSVAFVCQALDPGWWAWVDEERGAWHVSRVFFLVPVCWCGVESILCWARMGRRARIGLGDPVVGDRFRLFGIAMIAAFLSNAGAVLCSVLAIPLMGTSTGAIVVAPVALSAACIWLAFVPPRAYLQRLEARARRAG